MRGRTSSGLLTGGAGVLATGAALLIWQQVYLFSAVGVLGQVVDLDCADTGTGSGCRPIIEFTTVEGTQHRVRGPSGPTATTYEAGDEWLAVLYPRANPADASFPSELEGEYGMELVLFTVGFVLLALGWMGRVTLPSGEHPTGVWRLRGIAAGLGIVGSFAAYAVAWPHLTPTVVLSLLFATVAACVASLIVLGRRGHFLQTWSTLLTFGSAVLALVLWGGLLALPKALWLGYVACAPLAVVITLPLQAQLWPTLELAIEDVRVRVRRRARLRAALAGRGAAPEIIVRVESADAGEEEVELVRRSADGDEPLRAVLGAFPRTMVEPGVWYLLVAPVVEPRVAPASAGYRDVAREDWIVSAEKAERLGSDLDRALHAEPRVRMPSYVLPIPLVVGLVGGGLGGWALVDRVPPITGDPIPETGLVEGLDLPQAHSGRIEEVANWQGLSVGDRCSVRIEPTHRTGQTCSVDIVCGARGLYPGSGTGGYTRCLTSAAGGLVAEDTSAADGDPALRIDTRAGRAIVRATQGVADPTVTIALDVP